MKISEYHTMEKYEREYWWHLGRLKIVEEQMRIIQARLGKKKLRILNIGCGTGGTVPTLEQFGEVFNVDTEPTAIELLEQKGYKGALVSGVDLPYKNNHFDIIVAMDVLEHIDEEGRALAEWRRILQPKGELIITVPAYSWLWSRHDIALHHFRRYNRAQGRVSVTRAGLTPTKLSYMITFSLPLVAGFRLVKKITRSPDAETSYVDLPGPVNRLFAFFLVIESKWLKSFNLPCGTSLLVRAKK